MIDRSTLTEEERSILRVALYTYIVDVEHRVWAVGEFDQRVPISVNEGIATARSLIAQLDEPS